MYGLKPVCKRHNDTLARVGWDQLEVLLGTWYRGQGYEVEHTGTAGNGSKYDGGIDLKLRRPGEYVLVQVKHWNAYKVPHNDVHQLLGLMVNEGATGAILITSGEFTKAAIEAATRHGHVRLIDGDELRAMLGPLPEAAPINSALSPLGSRASERLLKAAEDRIRYGGRGRRRTVEVGLGLLLIKAAFALLTMLFIAAVLNGALRSVNASLRRPLQTSTIRPQPSAPQIARPSSLSPARVDPASACEESTYIDHCAPLTGPRAPTAAEIRESKRRADDAMKVLAPSTPEM